MEMEMETHVERPITIHGEFVVVDSMEVTAVGGGLDVHEPTKVKQSFSIICSDSSARGDTAIRMPFLDFAHNQKSISIPCDILLKSKSKSKG